MQSHYSFILLKIKFPPYFYASKNSYITFYAFKNPYDNRYTFENSYNLFYAAHLIFNSFFKFTYDIIIHRPMFLFL